MTRMHEDELEIGEGLVRSLLAEQFPEWVELPLRRIEPSGTVNAIFRLGDGLSVRLARREGPTEPGSRELDWLPKLAPRLPVEIPVPVAQGRPGRGYPWFWEIHTWVDGETVPVEEIDAIQAALDLAELVRALQALDPSGAPRRVPRGAADGRRDMGTSERLGRLAGGRGSRLLHAGEQPEPLPRSRDLARARAFRRGVAVAFAAVSGGAVATVLAVAAGLAGSVQVALMSRLGERIGVLEALAFSAALTAGLAVVILLLAHQSVAGFGRAVHQPWWMLLGGVMGLLIVFTVTYAGPRIGVAATVGILIAGQLAMGAAIDRWGLFGSQRIALHWPRLLGIALLAVGAALSLRKS